jgi:DNA-binding MarR family transcriptional regulator
MIAVYVDVKDGLLLASKDKSYHALYYILLQMDTQRNVWYADNHNKSEIQGRMNISTSTLAKYISSLVDRKLLLHEGTKGRYSLNMEVFSL